MSDKVIKVESKGREIIGIGRMPFIYGTIFLMAGLVIGLFSHLGSIIFFLGAGWVYAGGWPFAPSATGQSATESPVVVTRPPEPTQKVTVPPVAAPKPAQPSSAPAPAPVVERKRVRRKRD